MAGHRSEWPATAEISTVDDSSGPAREISFEILMAIESSSIKFLIQKFITGPGIYPFNATLSAVLCDASPKSDSALAIVRSFDCDSASMCIR